MIHLKFENMKNRLLILLMLVSSITFGQVTLDSARNYVNSNIVTNGTKAITGAKVNTSLNNIITAVSSLRKVDSIYYNGGADSLVYKINTKRYALPVGSGGALSSITAATSANTINNGDKTQTWTWNSISNQSGLKLSSTANGITSTATQKLFESVLTGAMFNSGNASYAGYFDNQQTIGGAYGIYARGGVAAQLEGMVNINGSLNVNNHTIWNNSGVTYLTPLSNQALAIGGGGDVIQNLLSGCATAFSVCKKTSGSKYVYGMGMAYQSGAYLSESTTNIFIERDGGNMLLSANTGLTGGFNAFTPNYQIAIAGATNNVGIGTTTPNASAKLDVSSTTQGFAPPEMTATQASAISTTSRKLIIYVTDTNGTFTSAGLWMWTGTLWKLILAQ